MAVFPQFNEKTKEGIFKQQDADECFQNIIGCLDASCQYENEEGIKNSLIKNLFELEFEVTLKNEDLPEEPEKVT